MTGQIVVGVDESAGAAAALRWAVREAELRDTTALAVLAWSWIDQQPTSTDFDPQYGDADADRALETMIDAALTADEVARVRRHTVCDLPARALLDAAAAEEMLVIGARGLGGFKGLFLGSVSQHCVHAATVPTVVVRDLPGGAGRAGIVVGVDGSEHARRALAWAADHARRRSTPVTVIHGYHHRDGAAARNVLDAALGELDTAGLDITTTADPSGAAAAILDAAADAELAVVGSRGLSALGRLALGSVATQVLHHAPGTVAIIP